MPPRGPRVKAEKPRDARGTLTRTLRYMVDYRYMVLVLLVCTFASNVGNLLGPSFAGKAIGAAVGQGQVDFATVAHYAKWMLAAYLFSNIMSFLVNQGMMLMGRRVANRMRRDVFHKLMVLPVSYFDRNQAGDIISRVSYDIDVVTTSLSSDLVQIMTSVVTVVGSLLMMCIISPPMTLCLFVTVPLAVGFTRYMGKRTRPLYSQRSAAYGKMNGYVEEMFSGQKTILAYAYENDVCAEFSGINHEAADAYCAADTLGTQKASKVQADCSVQPRMATQPSRMSTPTAIFSPNWATAASRNAGSVTAAVPKITRLRPMSRYRRITSRDRMPPPTWARRPVARTMRAMVSRFGVSPDLAPSRSTR